MDSHEKFIRVDDWTPGENDHKVMFDGKLIVIPFHTIFNRPSQALNTFIIKKESYVRQLPYFCQYINYFIRFYDPENELLLSYFKLKSLIDNKKQSMKIKQFMKAMYMILFTDSMKEKIHRMTEDNYYIPLLKSKEKFQDHLEFKEYHAKMMMRTSMCMKLMVPIMFHYINSNASVREVPLYTFYAPLFEFYEDDVDIYRKLDETVRARVHNNFKRNKLIWNQREILGTDQLIYIDKLLKENIISETMVKYRFMANVVAFNSVVIDRQLGYFLLEPYKYNMVELSHEKDPEGLSGMDKLEMNSAKTDESLIILSDLNIKHTIAKLMKQTKVEISKDEIKFYTKHHKRNKFQVELVYYYYAKYFYGYHDLSLIPREQYMTLLILLKKRLQYQGMTYLPEILSGNLPEKLNRRTIQNKKFLDKIVTSSEFQELMENKFMVLEELDKENWMLTILSTLLNTPFTMVSWDHPDKINERIEVSNQDILSAEFLSYMNQI